MVIVILSVMFHYTAQGVTIAYRPIWRVFCHMGLLDIYTGALCKESWQDLFKIFHESGPCKCQKLGTDFLPICQILWFLLIGAHWKIPEITWAIGTFDVGLAHMTSMYVRINMIGVTSIILLLSTVTLHPRARVNEISPAQIVSLMILYTHTIVQSADIQ